LRFFKVATSDENAVTQIREIERVLENALCDPQLCTSGSRILFGFLLGGKDRFPSDDIEKRMISHAVLHDSIFERMERNHN
jgi:hypothetical protein